MALNDLLELQSIHSKRKIGLSEERIRPLIPIIKQYIAFWREYPDLFVDFLQTGGDPTKPKKLKFYFYQRVFVRVAIRYRYVYATFPRAFSKSFLSVLVLMIRCILYPRAKLFSTAGGKEQASGILKEKVEEICDLVPAFNREIDRRRSPDATKESKDYCKYVFKGKSYFDNVAATERSRGKRRHGGLIEECVGVDGKILQEVLIPMMNVSRRCLDGSVQQDETLNKSQIFITTAGEKNSYPYDKLIQVLVQMVIQPDKAFIMGGTYRIPVSVGLIDKNFVSDLKNDGTYNYASFSREYESKWLGSATDAFFSGDIFDRNRVLQKAEYEISGRSSKQAYYILSMDVGRKGCASVVCVFKVTPQSQGAAIKSLVNIYTYDDTHFEDQAIKVKKLYYKYKAKRLVVDANGLGIGFLDYLIKQQIDPETDDVLPDFGVYNDDEGYYKQYRTQITEQDAIYAVKANAPINTEAYSTAQTQLSSGKVKFLIDERTAQNKLLGTKVGQAMTPEQRADYLRPYTLTSILRNEMLNLREENEGVNIILKQVNRSIRKDKFSALLYGLYYIKQEEDNKKKRYRFSAKDWCFFN